MAALMTDVTAVFTSAIGMVSTVISTITAEGNELVLLFCLLPLVGIGIGFAKRLMHV